MRTNHYFNYRDRCPACESESFKTIYSIPYDSDSLNHYLKEFYEPQGYYDPELLKTAQFELKECQLCELVFQSNVPNDFLLTELYDKWIDPDMALLRDRNLPLSYRIQRIEEVITILNHLEKSSNQCDVLDFGMGWGSLCLQFKAMGANVFGTELSEKRIANAKKLGIPVIHFDEDRQLFDFINTDDVFEHLTNPLEVLHLLKEKLKPNGIIKISVPNGDVAKHSLRKMNWYAPRGHQDNLNAVSPLEHLNCFTHRSLVKMAMAAGLIEDKTIRKFSFSRKDPLETSRNLYRRFVRKIRPTVIYFKCQ